MMISDMIRRAQEIVKEAGKLFNKAGVSGDEVIEKGYANYVTEVDYAVQEYLLAELDKITPGCCMISEESDQNSYDPCKPTWILDPVDGTTNLIYDYRHSAISLGLFMGGKPAAGIIYNPIAGEMFTAEAGKGAFLNGSKISVATNAKLEDCLIAFGTTPYDRKKADSTFETVKNIYKCCRDVRRSGSAALDIAYVACGRLDGYFELTIQPWDYGAGILILQEAGGMITDFKGRSLNDLKPSSVVATNAKIHQQLLNFFQGTSE